MYPQAQPAYPPGQSAYPQAQPMYPQGPPPTSRPPMQAAPAPRKRNGGAIALFIVVAVVIGTGIGWGATAWFTRGGADQTAVAVQEEPEDNSNAIDNGSVSAGDDSEPDEAAPELPADAEQDPQLPADPDEALTQLAESGAEKARSELDGLWVPQLSSKKVGLVAEGRTWDEQAILDEFEDLRDEYPDAELIWSGDFNSFKEDNFWVTIVGIGYDDPDDALAWCTAHSRGPDYCYAKQLTTSGGYEGTTRLQH